MPAQAQKYAFQPIGELDSGTASPRTAPRGRAGPSEADLEKARQEGLEAGRREAAGQTERATAEALRAIARMMQMMLSGLGQEAQVLRQDAVEVALAAANLMAGPALDRFGADAVVAFVTEAVGHLRDTPRLVVRVSHELAGEVEPLLVQAAAEAGFVGQIVVRPHEGVRGGDCQLEWADGTIHHDREAALASIQEAAERWLDSAASQGLQLDLFSP